MAPTPKLRWVERDGPMMGFHKNSDGSETTMRQKIRVLQQLWMPTNEPYDEWLKIKDGVWKDTPCERE